MQVANRTVKKLACRVLGMSLSNVDLVEGTILLDLGSSQRGEGVGGPVAEMCPSFFLVVYTF